MITKVAGKKAISPNNNKLTGSKVKSSLKASKAVTAREKEMDMRTSFEVKLSENKNQLSSKNANNITSN